MNIKIYRYSMHESGLYRYMCRVRGQGAAAAPPGTPLACPARAGNPVPPCIRGPAAAGQRVAGDRDAPGRRGEVLRQQGRAASQRPPSKEEGPADGDAAWGAGGAAAVADFWRPE